jgi:hypothetical protein
MKRKRVRARAAAPGRVTAPRRGAPAVTRARRAVTTKRARPGSARPRPVTKKLKRNPAAASLDAAMRTAAARFSDFTGHEARVIGKIDFPQNPGAGLVIGPIVGLAYEANRDGESEQYFHRFKAAARPLLVASPDGRQLFIVGGRYNFTARGIEDA